MNWRDQKKLAVIALIQLLLLAAWVVEAQPAGLEELSDPTRPYVADSRPAKPVSSSSPKSALILQSILISPQGRLAMINGQQVTIGSRLAGAEITDIQPYEVEITRAGKKGRLRLLSDGIVREKPINKHGVTK
jgi:hypothetical protein